MSIILIKGNCLCGAVQLELTLPNELASYASRVCDCDFCMERKIGYLSDPKGKLAIISKNKLVIHKHGSNQADFLECKNCQSILSAVHQFESGQKGAVNATLLENYNSMKPAQIVSPKQLSAKEKLERWRILWLEVARFSNDYLCNENEKLEPNSSA